MSTTVRSDVKEDLTAFSKQRFTGLEGLEALLSRASFGKSEVGELVDLTRDLLTDANSKVAQQALDALASAAEQPGAPVNSYASLLVPSVTERLGDSRQPVRDQAYRILVSYFKVVKPEIVLDKLSPFWQHKNWKVKQGLAEVIAEVVSSQGASFLGSRDQNNAVLKQIVRLMEEPEMIVREAAFGALDEMYRQVPAAVVSTINSSNLRDVQQRDVLARLKAQTGPDVGSDVSTKRSNGGLSMYSTDAGLPSSGSGGGYYVMPDVTAPIASSSGRVSGSGTAGAPAAVDAGYGRPSEARRQNTCTASASQPPPAAPAQPAKRGGFKDGGGITVDGEIPAASPIPITSERELRAELEAATATLAKAPNTEWQERMDAMQRVEGLVLGGAVEWECFHEAMKGLAQVLTQQFKERRSTIARQACHLIGVLARAMGPRFEPHAITLLPTLFGVVVITVAVMAESADVGVRMMLRHCQASRLLQAISDGVCKEKNPKTRQFCASYIVQILEQWDVAVWGRQLEAIEAAIRSAAQDSSADTRQFGRTALALYHAAQPERAQAFLKRLDSGLQERLSSGIAGAKAAKPAAAGFSRQSVSAAIAASRRHSRQVPAKADAPDAEGGILVVVPGASKAERVPEAPMPFVEANAAVAEPAAARPRGAVRSVTTAPPQAPATSSSADTAAESEGAARPSFSTLQRSSRKSLALPPTRIPEDSGDYTVHLGEVASTSGNVFCDPALQARIAAARKPRPSMAAFEPPHRLLSHPIRLAPEPQAIARVQASEQSASRPSIVPAQASTSSTRPAGAFHHTDGGGGSDAGSSGLVPLSRVVSAVVGGPRTWSDKVEALAALTAHVRASVPGAAPSPSRSFSSDPGSAAGSTGTGAVQLVAEPDKVLAALERVRERVMEALDDPHQKVLAAALTLATEIVRSYGRVMEGQLDRLLPLVLNKGAENKEQSRTLCADVLKECGHAYRQDMLVPALTKCLDLVKLPRGKQTVLEFFRGHIDRWGVINATHLKHWLVRLAPLLDDRTPELRKRAAEVLEALLAAPWAREPVTYVAYQHNSPDVAPLRRYLATLSTAAGGPFGTAAGSSSSGVSDGAAAPFTASHPAASMAVMGGPPAITGDSRRQLPSAAPALPLPLSCASMGPGPSHRGQPVMPAAGYERPAAAAAAAAQPSASSSRPYAPHPPGYPIPPNGNLPSGGGGGGGGFGPSTSGAVGPAGAVLRGGDGGGPRSLAESSSLAQLLDSARAAVGGLGGPGASAEQLAAAMEALADAAERVGREAWVRIFPKLMVEVNAWVQHPVRPVRGMAFVLMQQLLHHQPGLFTDNNLESQLTLLLHGCADETREVYATANQTLRLLLSGCSDRHGMAVLQQLLPRERELHRRSQDKGVRVTAIMEGVRQLAARLDRQELQRMAFTPHPETGSTLLEGLVANLSDAETSVRRAAVLTLVDLWCRLGHGVRDVLQVLASSSYNLICIYYLKQQGVTIAPGQGNATEHPLVLENSTV